MNFITEGKADLSMLPHYHQQGLITSRIHPQGQLMIHNYTQKAIFERAWDEVTINCRGLITDLSGKIVARGFPKFFNLEELSQEQQEALEGVPFTVTNKEDGSLGILYPAPDGHLAVATRGSFTSEQAIKATQLLYEKYPIVVGMYEEYDGTEPYTTLLVEIIYPENRIVLNYGSESKLILLAAINPKTGYEYERAIVEEFGEVAQMPIVERYDTSDYHALRELNQANKEGFVVQFHTDPVQRVKLKYAEYIRLHRLISGLNEQFIWDILASGQIIDPFLEQSISEEHWAWVRSVEARLLNEYNAIKKQAIAQFRVLGTRKDTALYFSSCDYPSVMFKMLDQKPYEPIIWKMIKPSGNQAP